MMLLVCRTAEVTVKLRNRGPDAYKRDVYGESIFVERKIGREGISSYKLKGEDGMFNNKSLYFLKTYLLKCLQYSVVW